jgi:hypothetical protein
MTFLIFNRKIPYPPDPLVNPSHRYESNKFWGVLIFEIKSYVRSLNILGVRVRRALVPPIHS